MKTQAKINERTFPSARTWGDPSRVLAPSLEKFAPPQCAGRGSAVETRQAAGSTRETPNPAGEQCGWGGGEAEAWRPRRRASTLLSHRDRIEI